MTIRLLHFPKTAGTTVSSTLLRVFGRSRAFAFSGNPEADRKRFMSLSKQERSATRLFIGHGLFETGIPEADAATTITFLREPVARVQSFIQHVSEGKSSYLRDKFQDIPFSIDAFLASGNGELSNLQTKMLVNLDRSESEKRIQQMGEDAALELARNRLFHKVAAFGIQNHFDEGWVTIWHALNRTAPLYAPLNRKTESARLEFTPAQTERIRELNRLDTLLFQSAEQEFIERVNRGFVPQDNLMRFRTKQTRFGPAFSIAWKVLKKIKG
jgi:hypothetical protein